MSGSTPTSSGASSVLTTKGDLVGYDTARNRLPIGTDDYILVPDATKALGVKYVIREQQFTIALSDETTDLEAGTNKAKFRIKRKGTIQNVYADLSTVATGATLVTVDINKNSSSILSTKLTIDASESTSNTATTPAVISDTAVSANDEFEIDIDAVGNTTTGQGLKVTIVLMPIQ